jgi:hypothetical protein
MKPRPLTSPQRLRRSLPWRSLAIAAFAALGAIAMPTARADEPVKPLPAATAQPAPETTSPALVEISILLDTSNSMDGLINQARTRLWSIVSELARAKRGGKSPDLRVALYEYGNSSLTKESGYIREVVALTDDLDLVSEKLFGLTTNGGDEYCGQVIGRAVSNLVWTEGDHYRAVFIAGNEPFTQGPTDFRVSCKAAIEAGIIVNTIHCGLEAEGISGQWSEAARLADGQFININQDHVEEAILAPQDERLRELNRKLNGTYVPYGQQGGAMQKRQEEMDEAAAEAAPDAGVQRAAAKSSGLYKAGHWDLVDGLTEGRIKLADVKDKDLPEEMRKLSPEERQVYLDKKKAERAAIKKEMQELSEARRDFVGAERKRLAEAGGEEDTFGRAVEKMLGEQLEKKGYEVPK